MTKFIDLSKLKGKKPKFTQTQKTLIMRAGLMTLLVALLAGAAALNTRLDRQIDVDPQEVAAAVRSARPSPTVPATAKPAAQGQAVSTAASPSGGANYFENFRSDRARLREKQLTMLDEVIAAAPGSEAAKEASEEKIEVTERMEAEFAIEQVLLAKGFTEAVCIVRDDNATVAVKKMKLSDADTATILAAVMDATDLHPDEIKVIAVA